MKRAGAALVIGAVYLAVTGWGGPMNAAIALFVGFALARAFPGPRRAGAELDGTRLLRLPWLVAGVLVEIARGTASIFLVLVGRASRRNIGFVSAPLGKRSERGAVVSAFVATSSPGSVVVEVDEQKRVMKINVVDATRPNEVRDQLDRFYEKYQRGSIP